MPVAKPSQIIAPRRSIALPATGERRADDRVQTVFRVARAITAADEGLARIRNMSDRGAGLRMLMPAGMVEPVTLELVDGVALRGQVVWQRGEEFGLVFDQPIGSAELLAALAAGARCGRTRPVRLPVAATALTRSARGLRAVRLVDISQRGLKLEHDGSLTEGLELTVTLPCGLDSQGIVRWTNGNRAGVMLLEALAIDALGSARRLVRPAGPMVWLPAAPHDGSRP